MWDVVVFLESTVSKKEEKGERNIGSLEKKYENLEKEGASDFLTTKVS